MMTSATFTEVRGHRPRVVEGKRCREGDGRWRPWTVPGDKTSGANGRVIVEETVMKLQGGGQMKWKTPPSDKKRRHQHSHSHPSSIQLPAVYETWKAPSRLNRRRARAGQGLAAGPGEARRTSRSVPSLSRREKAESPAKRPVNSAPTANHPTPTNHERHHSEGALTKKSSSPPRLPKLNTLVSGVLESNSPTGSPALKPKHSKQRDAGTKVASPPPISETKAAYNASVHHGKDKNEHAKVELLDIKSPKNSPKLTSRGENDKSKRPVASDKGHERLKLDDADRTKTQNSERTTHKNGNEQSKTTVKLKDKPVINDDVPAKKPTERTVETRKTDKSSESVNNNATHHASKLADIAKSRATSKVTSKVDEHQNPKILARAESMPASVSAAPAVVPVVPKHPPRVKAESPAKTPPKRGAGAVSRAGSIADYRVNPRSKTDLTRVKPPLKRRTTKTGYFNSSGEFVTNDTIDDGNKSVFSTATGITRKTNDSLTSQRSDISKVSTTATTKTTASSNASSRKPMKRRPVIITKKTLARQKFYNSVYDNQHYKLQRQTIFLKKVENAQLKMHDDKVQKRSERERKKYQSVVRQYQDLKKIRDQFDEEQVKRFSRQYVSWKSVETDRLKRNSDVYGLPDQIYDDRYEKTLKEIPKAKKPTPVKKTEKDDKKFSRFARWVRNIKRFESILKPNTGEGLEGSLLHSVPKGALVEGRDLVELHVTDSPAEDGGESGGSRTGGAATGSKNVVKPKPRSTKQPKKIVKVRNIIGSAKRLLQATQDMDAISEVSIEDDDDDRPGIYNGYDSDDVSSLELSDDDEK